MLREIRASFACDGCGAAFSVQMEPPYEPPPGWSLFDCAVDAVRGSIGYEGPKSIQGFKGDSIVEDGRQLCGRCGSDQTPGPAGEGEG